MSSTNRGGAEREADDHYTTPWKATRAIVAQLFPAGRLAPLRVLEPSAGEGAIVRELLESGALPQHFTLVERDEGRAERMMRAWAGSGMTIVCDDFLRVACPTVDLVVMNPPFSAAEQHVERAISFLAPGGRCAALLRLAFCASAKRAPFRAKHPFDLYPLASRPSFTPDGKTDSADYAWFVFHAPGLGRSRRGGHFEVIEGSMR